MSLIILLSGDLESEVGDASSFADFLSRVMSYDNSELSTCLQQSRIFHSVWAGATW